MRDYQNQIDKNPQHDRNQNPLQPKLEAEALPADYLEQAENVIRVIAGKGKRDQITTSKLRNLYSLVTGVYDQERLRPRTEKTLLDTSVASLQRARIRFAYEYGRDSASNATRVFVKEAKLIPYLKWVGTDRAKLMRFAHYMEALVAYHRFYHVGNER